MINNPEGKKLSKRDGAMDVIQYKRDGYLAEALLNFLVRLGWSNKDQEIFSMEEMLELFDPNNINKSASAYNEEKLKWLNAHYIKSSSNERIQEELKFFECNLENIQNSGLILDICKERAQTLVELKDAISNILNTPTSYEEKGVNKFVKEDTINILKEYLALLEENEEQLTSVEDYEKITKPFIETKGLKFPQLFQPIRIALTGGTQAPSVYEIMAILGYKESVLRLNRAISCTFLNN